MAITKWDIRSDPPFGADATPETNRFTFVPPALIPISLSDFETISHLLVTTGENWYARHVNVPERGKNIVIVTQASPTASNMASLLIAPSWNGYLVFFHSVSMSDPDQDFVVSNCRSMSDLCSLITEHCGLPRTDAFTYSGVSHVAAADADSSEGGSQNPR